MQSKSKAVARPSKSRFGRQQSYERPLTRRRGFWLAVGSAVVVVALAALAVGAAFARGGFQQNVAGATSGAALWGPNSDNLAPRLASVGLPALTAEGTALHIHAHLDLYVQGQQVTIPADVGVDVPAGILSPLHTHDATGIIHVESPTTGTFFLGQFFEVWGIPISDQCLGTYCAGNGNQLSVWVNGQPYSGNPASLALAEHQIIVIAYGTPAQMPTQIPTTYNWNGL